MTRGLDSQGEKTFDSKGRRKAPNVDRKDYPITILENGKIKISKKNSIIRVCFLTTLGFLVSYRINQGIVLNDPLLINSNIMLILNLIVLIGAWYWYKFPANLAPIKENENSLVSVIIPIYNQKNMIELVINSIYQSKYRNFEVIAIDDGSFDGTREILDQIQTQYNTLRVVHQKREGKRKAIANGFFLSNGQYILLIDSDSVIDENAISEIIRTFKANPNVGSVTGEIRIWNSNKNLLTQLQDAEFNFSCNINKAYESSFRSVICCSGSLSAYRREAITNIISHWRNSSILNEPTDNRKTVIYNYMNPAKANRSQALRSFTNLNKIFNSVSRYDDADDRLLTAQSLIKWESVYVLTAIAYVEGQESFKNFIKQQIRWKKGFLRSTFYLSIFFWKKRHPFMSIVYYLDIISNLTVPIVVLTVLIYEPLILKLFWSPLAFIGAIMIYALSHGIDLKIRSPCSKIWITMMEMKLFSVFVLSWMLLIALLNIKKNIWMTR
jgi:hyaluronan synthase